ncbi:MAG: nucleotidyltransferase family protein [Gammaproteobacteria bacterium]|nr:MAG: nucleotidyltransferase family protein [Gammaproteobacteria bacterium]
MDTAMILAAGLGTRMRPLTESTPKPLLKAGGKALIEYLIEALAAAGFSRLVINHAWLGAQIESTLGSGTRWGVQIHYSAEGEPLETAGGIKQALPLIDRERFAVVNGDIWTDFPFTQLRDVPDCEAFLVLADNPEHHPQGDFALREDGRVDVNGQPLYTFTGIGVYQRSLFEPLPSGPWPLAPVLRGAMQRRQARGMRYSGHWHDIGTPDRLAWLDDWLG